MATRPARKPAAKKPSPKRGKALPYDALLKLASKMKPPQKWFDESENPFEPDAKRGTAQG
jgi:hypothetical protein